MGHEAWAVDTSLGDLVRVVADQMLVVSLPQRGSFDKDSTSLADGPLPSLPAMPGAELSVSPKTSLIFDPATATSSSLADALVKQRASAWMIKESLERICDRARENSTYLLPLDIVSTRKGDDVGTASEA